jgi:hypothetical protein
VTDRLHSSGLHHLSAAPGKVVRIFPPSKWALDAISFLEILDHEAQLASSKAFFAVIDRRHWPGYYRWRYTLWAGKEVVRPSASILGEMSSIRRFAWVP